MTKVRVVIEEVVVDAECADTTYPGSTMKLMVEECVKAALSLHEARKLAHTCKAKEAQ